MAQFVANLQSLTRLVAEWRLVFWRVHLFDLWLQVAGAPEGCGAASRAGLFAGTGGECNENMLWLPACIYYLIMPDFNG